MERFWNKVKKTDGCWEWMASKNNWGYPLFWYKGRSRPGNRVCWELTRGSAPEAQVLHRCDNPGCVRPDHLYSGTHDQNMRDKVDRDRCFRPAGSLNKAARLTEAQVADVRRDQRLHRVIAQEYGVTRSQISKIKRGDRWSDAPLQPNEQKPEAPHERQHTSATCN